MMILRTYRQFTGRVWLAYDRALREHAAATNLMDWLEINTQLFNFHSAGASVRDDAAYVPSESRGAALANIVCRSWNNGRCVMVCSTKKRQEQYYNGCFTSKWGKRSRSVFLLSPVYPRTNKAVLDFLISANHSFKFSGTNEVQPGLEGFSKKQF